MRAFISGAFLLIVGILIGVVIGPDVRAAERDAVTATSVTASPTPTAAATSSSPAPSPTTSTAPAAVPGLPTPPVDPPLTVALGDSITVIPDSWVHQLCTAGVVLQKCENAGIRGNTTVQMLARLDTDVLNYRPSYVIVMGGTNDLKRRTSITSILRRLDVIVDRVTATGAVAVLCTIPPRNDYSKRALALNVAIRDYAARGKVPLLDLYSTVGTKSGHYKPGLSKDGVHPTLAGADLMTARANLLLPALLHPVAAGSPLPGRAIRGR